jgi:hypothetical protein
MDEVLMDSDTGRCRNPGSSCAAVNHRKNFGRLPKGTIKYKRVKEWLCKCEPGVSLSHIGMETRDWGFPEIPVATTIDRKCWNDAHFTHKLLNFEPELHHHHTTKLDRENGNSMEEFSITIY